MTFLQNGSGSKTTNNEKKRELGKSIGRIVYAHPSSGDRFFVKGQRNFDEIKTINGFKYPTYKVACYALGLLDSDQEWHDAIIQASQWSTRNQLRELFVTILLFCEVSDPFELWNKNYQILTEDLPHRQRKILRFEELTLTDAQVKNYGLYEIEKILVKSNKSLKDFPPLPSPNQAFIRELDNRLLREELSYNIEQLANEHRELYRELNVEQMNVYNVVLQSVVERK